MPRSEVQVLTPGLLRAWPLPEPGEGKHERGTVLVVGGSRSTPGAVRLAGVAALRAGAGRLQVATVESAASALAVAVPEAMVVGLPESPGGCVVGAEARAAVDLAAAADVVLVGPGLDDAAQTRDLLGLVLDGTAGDTFVVLDALALGILAEEQHLLGGHPAVLTPNLDEAGRLLGRPTSDLDDDAATIAETFDVTVTAYGHVATPDGRRWRDENADVGLGTSGSGDVAAGVVAGLLARTRDPAQAACWGTYVHAAAGQRLVPTHGRTGYLARDLVDQVAPTICAV